MLDSKFLSKDYTISALTETKPITKNNMAQSNAASIIANRIFLLGIGCIVGASSDTSKQTIYKQLTRAIRSKDRAERGKVVNVNNIGILPDIFSLDTCSAHSNS